MLAIRTPTICIIHQRKMKKSHLIKLINKIDFVDILYSLNIYKSTYNYTSFAQLFYEEKATTINPCHVNNHPLSFEEHCY